MNSLRGATNGERRRFAVIVLVCGVLAASSGARAADRQARVINPDGSPLSLDPQRAVLFDTPLVWVSLRNEHTSPVSYVLRLWIFQADGSVRGTLDYCTADVLDRATRSRINIPIGIGGVTMRDRAVVTILRAASGRMTWTLRESDADQLDVARRAANGSGGRLTFERRDDAAQPWTCPCDCHAIQAACDQTCTKRGSAAFTCAPIFAGACSASCTCK